MLLLLGIGGAFMWLSHGHYHPVPIVIYTLLMLGPGCFCLKSKWYRSCDVQPGSSRHVRETELPLALLICLFLLLNIIHAGPIYIGNTQWAHHILSVLGFSFVSWDNDIDAQTWHNILMAMTLMSFLVVLLPFLRNSKRYLALSWFVIALLLTRKYLALPASPAPYIDVFTLGKEAAHHLFSLTNPYSPTVRYTDIYTQTDFNIVEYIYWPLTLYAQAVGEWLFGDVRGAYLFLDSAVLLGFCAISRQLGGDYRSALLIGIVWLAIPVQIFFAEQAWTEIVILPFMVWGFLFLLKRQLLATAVAVGLAVAAKQYAVLLLPVVATFVLRHYSLQDCIKFLLMSGSVALFTMLPYLALDFSAFFDNTVLQVLGAELRPNSFSVAALLKNELDMEISGALNRLILAALLLAALAVTWLSVVPERAAIMQLAATLFVLYSLIFLFGHQGFCNYYVFTLIFPLLLLQLRTGGYRRIDCSE